MCTSELIDCISNKLWLNNQIKTEFKNKFTLRSTILQLKTKSRNNNIRNDNLMVICIKTEKRRKWKKKEKEEEKWIIIDKRGNWWFGNWPFSGIWRKSFIRIYQMLISSMPYCYAIEKHQQSNLAFVQLQLVQTYNIGYWFEFWSNAAYWREMREWRWTYPHWNEENSRSKFHILENRTKVVLSTFDRFISASPSVAVKERKRSKT